MKIELLGLGRLAAKFKALQHKYGARPQESVSVGFTQNYALYVHENLKSYHPVGQAKYLEQPAREHRKEIIRIITVACKRGATLLQGMLLGGLRLQRESQKLVPIDTGALRASAFTKSDN